jgi:apolipoprotein N-acyltransferase
MQTSLASKEPHLEDLRQGVERPVLAVSHSWVWLAVAAALLLFSNGANTIPLAAWLSPLFLLRFVRQQSFKIGLPLVYLLLAGAFAFQFRGMVPIPGIGYYIFLVAWGIPLVLPYVMDRLVARKLSGLTATLVFPTAWAAAEYVASRGPYGTWGSAAYSQYGNLPLVQVLSVTGLWGITFLMGWFASMCNWIWEEGLDSKQVRRGSWLFAGTIATVTLLGGARIALFPPSSQTVRVASISKRAVKPGLSDAVAGRMFQGQATSEDMVLIQPWVTALHDDLLSRAEREMQAGAQIVFWGEANAPVLKEDEAALVTRGSEMAAKYPAIRKQAGPDPAQWTGGVGIQQNAASTRC